MCFHGELGWVWGEPESWTWQKVGGFDGATLKSGFLVIRDGHAGRDTALDPIAFFTHPELAEEAFAPEPLAVSLDIAWFAPVADLDAPVRFAPYSLRLQVAGR